MLGNTLPMNIAEFIINIAPAVFYTYSRLGGKVVMPGLATFQKRATIRIDMKIV